MAGTLEIPSIGSANSTADPKVKANFETLNNKLSSSNTLPDTSLESPNNSVYRTLQTVMTEFAAEAAAGTYFLYQGGYETTPATPGVSVVIPTFFLVSSDYTVAGKTTKLNLRAQVSTNATKPAIKFTFGLYPVTFAGGASTLTMTLGTVVSGSTVEINEPAKELTTGGTSTEFTFPSEGLYVFGLVTSAKLTASNKSLLSAQLRFKHV